MTPWRGQPLGVTARSLGGELATLDQVAGDVVPDDPAAGPYWAAYYRDNRLRLAEDLWLCRRYFGAPPAGILEIGSVPPFLTAALQRVGFRVTGLDIAPARCARVITALGLDIRKCDIERSGWGADLPKTCFVLMNEVFEHLRIDLPGTMREVVSVLPPGGRLLLSTPNLYSYRGIRNFLWARRAHAVCGDPYEEFGKLHTAGHMGHVREYTPREVREFVARFGMAPVATLFRGTVYGAVEPLVTRLVPALRPFATYVFDRVGGGP